jgi:hypothetical protein
MENRKPMDKINRFIVYIFIIIITLWCGSDVYGKVLNLKEMMLPSHHRAIVKKGGKNGQKMVVDVKEKKKVNKKFGEK